MRRTKENLLQDAMKAVPAWQDNFKARSLKVGFQMSLTRPMVEYLSAVADGVEWDRANYGGANVSPDNFLATSSALYKRGLIERKVDKDYTPEERTARARSGVQDYDHTLYNHWKLSPAGNHVVELLKMAGVFIEADAALKKKASAK